MAGQRLFEKFPPISTEKWMEKITTDLKGADFEKRLVWKTNEGFSVNPFYRSEDLEGLNHPDSLPGQWPYVRSGKKDDNSWFIRQDIKVTDYRAANAKALDILMRGVDSLCFEITDPDSVSEKNLEVLLTDIETESIELNFSVKGKALELLEALKSIIKKRGTDPASVRGSIEADPLTKLMVNGSLCTTTDKAFDYVADLYKAGKEFTSLRKLQIQATAFNNAGADIVTGIGFAISLGSEYMHALTTRGIDAEEAARGMGFTFAIGSNYFMEIAKLRAARVLWAMVTRSYGTDVCMNIHCETSEWNKTVFDPYVNMLRTQTEAMSATLGGTDSLTVDPFDKVFRKPGEFSERIARNQQLLLKEEAHFDKVIDPSAGSYYIENLTSSLSAESWKLFVETEDKGGFLKQLTEGEVQKRVSGTSSKRVSDIAFKREILLGTNQYADDKEKIAAAPSTTEPVAAGEGVKVTPVRIFRGAEEFEKLRLEVSALPKQPVVFLLTYGNLAMRKARAQFSQNFFNTAGFRVIDTNGFATIEEGVKAAAGADFVVLCSSDDEYETAGPEAYKLLNGKAHLVIAGAPASAPMLQEAGIKYFISMRSNVLETMRTFTALIKG